MITDELVVRTETNMNGLNDFTEQVTPGMVEDANGRQFDNLTKITKKIVDDSENLIEAKEIEFNQAIAAGVENFENAIVESARYKVAIPFAINTQVTDALQSYSYNNVIYAPMPSLVPFNTGGSFNGSQFFMIGSYSDLIIDKTTDINTMNLLNVKKVTSKSYDGNVVGGAEWIETGVTTLAKAGAKDFDNGLIYDILGKEFEIQPIDATIDVRQFGAIGDGATDNTSIVNSCLLYPQVQNIYVDKSCIFKIDTSTLNVNLLGKQFIGGGVISKTVTGGQQKQNNYGDEFKYVTGTEYIHAFHQLLITQHTSATRKPIIVFSGDSTTAGGGVDADYQLDDLIKKSGEMMGLQTPYGLNCINRGQSGKNTAQWVRDFLAGDLALNPDVLVLRWGINDPGYYKADIDTGPALNAGQDAAGRRDAGDFLTSMKQGLTTIRASKTVSQMSIILMMPNSVSDVPNGRDAIYFEQITNGLKKLAREFKCVFIDTYAYLRDSVTGGGIWMDNPLGFGGIHPANTMNIWITDLISKVIFPQQLANKIGRNNILNRAGAEFIAAVTDLPNTYQYGVSINRGTTGWKYDGSVITVRSQDETVFQINFPYKSAETKGYAFRVGRSAVLGAETLTWDNWVTIGSSKSNVTASVGYTGASTDPVKTVKNGSQITMEGYFVMNAPAIISAGTTIGTVATGYRSAGDGKFGVATVWNGSAYEQTIVVTYSDGDVRVQKATTINANRIWVNIAYTTE